MRRAVCAAMIVVSAAAALAGEADTSVVRPVTSGLTVGYGTFRLRDTYLTPLRYDGGVVTVRYDRWRRMRCPRLTALQEVAVTFAKGSDRGDHGDAWAGRLHYRYALHFGLVRDARWSLLVGPYGNSEAGFNYNLKLATSNNPATARVITNVGASVAAGFRYRIAGKPCTALLLAQMPVVGVAFVPEYGASYYETFYLDTTDDDWHSTHFGNQQDLDLRVTTDIPVAVIPWLRRLGTVVRLGFQYHIETMKINDITTRFSTIEGVIGWSWQHIPYRHDRRCILRDAPVEAW